MRGMPLMLSYWRSLGISRVVLLPISHSSWSCSGVLPQEWAMAITPWGNIFAGPGDAQNRGFELPGDTITGVLKDTIPPAYRPLLPATRGNRCFDYGPRP